MQVLALSQFENELQARPKGAHKGDFGHVLVIGGDAGYAGAVMLAAMAALRVGAGLVSVATRASHAGEISQLHPEIMAHGVETPRALQPLLERASVLVLGPGLGRSAWSWTVRDAALSAGLPMVLDADGLTMLAAFPLFRSNWILTPHPGEAARLLKMSTEAVQQDRARAVASLVQFFGGVAVLKGQGTLVANTVGDCATCEAGNPGMATAGMGDVLSGVIGGLLSQGIGLEKAARLGVLLHAMAGDLAAAQGGERGMVASDLMPWLRRLVNQQAA